MESRLIKKLVKGDASSVFGLEKECFSSPWPLEQIEYELETNPCAILLGVFQDKKLIGYIDFMITFDSATINRLAVANSFRKQGIASSLLKEMERICHTQEEPVEYITLEVRKSNLAAHSLYLQAGYNDVTIKKMYYDDGEDAIYMMRSLL